MSTANARGTEGIAGSRQADTEPASAEPVIGKVACLGGGHGLFNTLRAAGLLGGPAQSRTGGIPEITAIVTVADDGGSSGRLRRELGQIPPGDLRMALAALAGPDEESRMWARLLQHRFGGNGALAGHAVGNLILAGLAEVLGDEQGALDAVARLTKARGRVLPMALEPLEIEADVAGLDEDPRIVRVVRGQVAVASTVGTVRRVRLNPSAPAANPEAVAAIREADFITVGPGSWFSSVIPHLLVPGITEAITQAQGLRVVVLNLTAEAGETAGFSHERHLHMLMQHAPGLRVDRVLVDSSVIENEGERRYLAEAAALMGAELAFADVRSEGLDDAHRDTHDPAKLASALANVYTQAVQA